MGERDQILNRQYEKSSLDFESIVYAKFFFSG